MDHSGTHNPPDRDSQISCLSPPAAQDYSWHELRKIYGVGETGTVQSDYGDTVLKAL